jgi:hypothetical protein
MKQLFELVAAMDALYQKTKMNPQTPDNEVALSESVWGAYWPDWESRAKAMKMACEKLEEEIARLRGLLKDHATFLRKNGFDRQADDLMRFAPAPEEPVSECQDCGVPLATAEQINKRCSPCMMARTELLGATMDEWYGGFSKIESTEPVIQENRITEPVSEYKECEKCGGRGVVYGFLQGSYGPSACHECSGWSEKTTQVSDKEPAFEWRELGPDEVICEGDEVQPKHHVGSEWVKAWSFELGVKAGHFKAMRYRTRRPLPKQEEMPLEGDIEDLEEMANSETLPTSIVSIAAKTACALRYLRDEIHKLKEAQ